MQSDQGSPVFVSIHVVCNIQLFCKLTLKSLISLHKYVSWSRLSLSTYVIKTLFSWHTSQRTTKPTKWYVRPVKTQISLVSQIRVAVSMKKACILSYPLSAQQRLWSDWVDTQADLSLWWAHTPFCRFCHALAPQCRSERGKLCMWNASIEISL